MKIKDIVKYFCRNYPYKQELSKARLTKMVYLADWKKSLVSGRQMTNLQWKYNHYGPYIDDVVDQIRDDDDFSIKKTTNLYGSLKEVICLISNRYGVDVEDDDKKILDFVIEKTAPKSWSDFIKLVYSTYPVATMPKGSYLNLPELAGKYKSKWQI